MLTSCSSMLVQDVTPPPDFIPTWQVSDEASSSANVAPLLPPDPSEGESIYQINCGACHGETGMGDGEKAGGLPSIPPPVGSLEYSREFSPDSWYQVVTMGRMERLMPGFAGILSDRQRWDVVSYLFTMDVKPWQLDDGQKEFLEICQNCAGQTGNAHSMEEIVSPELLQHSLNDVIVSLENGYGSMPAIPRDLPDGTKLNIALYLRSLVFSKDIPDDELSLSPVQETLFEEGAGITTADVAGNLISGRVVNDSGEEIPGDQKVELAVFDQENVVYTDQMVVTSGGRFEFNDVPEGTGLTYLVSANYSGVIFSTSVIRTGKVNELANLILTVYETDTDVSPVSAERMYLFFEFPQADILRIKQMYMLSNPTNRFIKSTIPGEPVIRFTLPSGASNLEYEAEEDKGRYIPTSDGFGDTQGIPPGNDTQIVFSFDLIYKPDLPFYITLPFSVESTNVLLPSGKFFVKSSRLHQLGEKVIQNSTWTVYQAERMESGSHLDLVVSGKPAVADMIVDEWNTNLVVGIFSLIFVLLTLAILVHQKTISSRKVINSQVVVPMSNMERDAILDAIIALDDQYNAGYIPHSAYVERRNELKGRLNVDQR